MLINNIIVDFFVAIKDFVVKIYNIYFNYLTNHVGHDIAIIITIGIGFVIVFLIFMAFMNRDK